MKKILKKIGIIVGISSILLLGGCGANKTEIIKIGHKNFTEQRIAGEMISLMIEKNTKYKTSVKEFGGTMLIFQAMKSKDINIYPSYTGTAYRYILKQNKLNNPQDVFNYVKKQYQSKYGITWLDPLGFNNTYTFAVKPELAKKYNLKTFSDLAKIGNKLRLGAEGDFFDREDGMPGITKTYGLKFKENVTLDIGLKYLALKNNKVDVIDAYTTDGKLKTYNLKILKDSKNFFPPYYIAPILNTKFAENHPEIVKQLKRLGNKFTEEEMQELNYKVEALEMPIEKVVTDVLKQKGLIK